MSTGSFALTRATTPSWRFMSRLDGALEAMQGESMTGAARRMTHGVAECDSKPNAGHGLCEAWRSSSAWMLAVVDDRARGAAAPLCMAVPSFRLARAPRFCYSSLFLKRLFMRLLHVSSALRSVRGEPFRDGSNYTTGFRGRGKYQGDAASSS